MTPFTQHCGVALPLRDNIDTDDHSSREMRTVSPVWQRCSPRRYQTLMLVPPIPSSRRTSQLRVSACR